jgi:hypothetical protein
MPSAVNKLVNGSSEVRLAIAFWGDGAVKKLGIQDAEQVTIICNIRSGSCNPAEIERLSELTQITVFTHDDLHAKVYLTPHGAVVGSSNASANGLAEEGPTAEGLREANLQTDDRGIIDLLGKWFTERLNESEPATPELIEEASELWAHRNQTARLRRTARHRESEANALCEEYGGSWAVPLDQDLFKAIHCYGQFLSEKNGNSVKQNINRHCRSVEEKGSRQSLIDMTKENKESKPVKRLIDAKKPKCTAEYIVWQHSQLFSPDLVKRVYDRLTKHGVLLGDFP